MTRVICAPAIHLPVTVPHSAHCFALFSNPGRADVGTIAPDWPDKLRRQGFAPSVPVWDFVSLALAVAAADLACLRAGSSDGWTRMIELDVHLHDPAPWLSQCGLLEKTLRFLTGDFWTLNLLPGGEPPPTTTAPAICDADCVSLLSGGVDSLVGAIDLTAQGHRPIFVSQVAKGDAQTQRLYAREVGAADRHFQWNHRIRLVNPSERSTRGRSIIFFAFAALATATLGHAGADGAVDVFVPENGFISLNPPLNPGRFGSLSTKTTHPVFLSGLQAVWDAVGIRAVLRTPYQFLTKGQLLANCSDQQVLQRLVGDSTSCGRFGYYGYTHCGRCVPCMVRRAAFLAAGLPDTTPRYRFLELRQSGREKGPNDIGAMAVAYLNYQSQGLQKFIGGATSFADSADRPRYESVLERGILELGALLQSHGVI